MKMLKNSDGFSALEVALLVIVMGLIGTSGYYVYNENKDDTPALATQSTTTDIEKSSSLVLGETFNMEGGAFSFKYPSDWHTISSPRNTAAYVRLTPDSLEEKHIDDSRVASQGLLSVYASYYTGTPQEYISNSTAERKLEYQSITLAANKAGYSAYKSSVITQGAADKKYSGQEYDIFHNGTHVSVTVFTSMPSNTGANIDLSEYEPTISEIINSFVISDTQVRLPGQCIPGHQCAS